MFMYDLMTDSCPKSIIVYQILRTEICHEVKLGEFTAFIIDL